MAETNFRYNCWSPPIPMSKYITYYYPILNLYLCV